MIRQVTFKFYDTEESHIKCPGYLWTFHLNKVQDCHQKLKTISFTCIQISSWHAPLNYLLKTFWFSSCRALSDSLSPSLSLSVKSINIKLVQSWKFAKMEHLSTRWMSQLGKAATSNDLYPTFMDSFFQCQYINCLQRPP